MDFARPAEHDDLAAEAAALARDWAARTPFPEDSWIVGHDAGLAKELAGRRWIGMTWPTEYG
ncbi:MAG: acyl-CoA dehydrogenase family protein, partial [Acidimicrobiales bacterium]